MGWIRRYGLYCAWLIACLQTLGSLYYSNIRHFEPCHLCWYQRVCVFPLAIILGIATYRGFVEITRYVLPQIVLGLLFALYQVMVQEIPGAGLVNLCGDGLSCADKTYVGLGPITLPMASLLGFFLIGFFLLVAWQSKEKPGK